MPPGEFELIARYFSGRGARRQDVTLAVGDDGALLMPPPAQQLVQVLDSIVSGVHFPHGLDGRHVGYRALAVNLSDLAAMGAEPAWVLLGLTLPAIDEPWLEQFSGAVDALARRHDVSLVGGDTCSGPLSVTVAATGFVPSGQALRRDGAKAGDLVWVSGTPGDAGAGLALWQERLEASGEAREFLLRRFLQPEPRVSLGLALRSLASACIDVSDGLLADLGQMCRASGLGAVIDARCLPLSAALREVAGDEQAARLALTAGDDYELLFAAPASATEAIRALGTGVALTAIGCFTAAPGVQLSGLELPGELRHGFDHFAPAGSRG